MAETALPAADPAAFLDQAAQFANHTLWGTLAPTVLIDPRTHRDADVARALTRAVTGLRYGTVAVNMLAVGIPQATWGGYPGQPDTDIQTRLGHADPRAEGSPRTRRRRTPSVGIWDVPGECL